MRRQLTNAEAAVIYRTLNKRVTPRLVQVARGYGEPQAALMTTALVLGWMSDAGFTRADVLQLVDVHFPAVASPQLTVVSR